MDPLRSLPGIVGSLQVEERRGGGRQQADAFRRALQHGGGDPAAGGEQPPVPRPASLQRQPVASRKDDGSALHVDVLA
jgi:hypothetical protein